MTYRASVSTDILSRQQLLAALEEWPRVHRSILLRGVRLSVDDTCPVIIQSLDEEECEWPSQPEMRSTFLATMVSVLVIAILLGMVAVAVTSCIIKNYYRKIAIGQFFWLIVFTFVL